MIRRNWLSFWCALAILLSAVSAQAQGGRGEDIGILRYALECDEADSSLCSQPLMRGEKAPFAGQLLTTELAILLSQKALDFDIELTIEMQKVQKLHEIELNYQKKISDIESKSKDKQIKVLEKKLEEVGKVSWYRHPAFVITVSCVTTVIVIFGSTYLYEVIH